MRVAVCGNAACVRLVCRRSAAWQPHSSEAPIFATIYPERCFPKSLKIPVTAPCKSVGVFIEEAHINKVERQCNYH